MFSKVWLMAIAAVAAVVLLWWWQAPIDSESAVAISFQETLKLPPQLGKQGSLDQEQSLALQQPDSTPSSEEPATKVFDPVAILQKIHLQEQKDVEWRASLGDFSPEDLEPYLDYDLKILYGLAKQCDLKAFQVLVRKRIRGKQGAWINYVNTVCGATSSVQNLLSGKFIPKGDYIKIKKEQPQRYNTLEYLAMEELAAMRGDKAHIFYGVDWLNNAKIILTEAEKQAISRHAKQVYAQLEAQRQAWGFPPFNNYIPVYQSELLSKLLYEKENPSGWGLYYYDYVYKGTAPW